MHTNSVRCALHVAYTALCEATSLATGKPVGDLSDFLIGKMMDDGDIPPDVASILGGMIRKT